MKDPVATAEDAVGNQLFVGWILFGGGTIHEKVTRGI
jgi:hypothetical protein